MKRDAYDWIVLGLKCVVNGVAHLSAKGNGKAMRTGTDQMVESGVLPSVLAGKSHSTTENERPKTENNNNLYFSFVSSFTLHSLHLLESLPSP